MYLYRAKEFGNRKGLNEICLKIIKRGDHEQIYGILPHIRILRSRSFYSPLLRLLTQGNPDQKSAAILALGCLGDDDCIPHLSRIYDESLDQQGLRIAVIEALGEISSNRSVEVLVNLTETPQKCEKSEELEHLISALGQLAQQGMDKAEKQLVFLMSSARNPTIASMALTETLVSYWHRPEDVPDQLLQKISQTAAKGSKEVTRAALTALSSLIQLGNEKARPYLRQIRSFELK